MYKDDFPILKRHINGSRLIYLDNAATTQKPKIMIDRLISYLKFSNANIHRGIYKLTEESTDLFEATRDKVANLLSSLFTEKVSMQQIIFSKNATESINIVASSMLSDLQKGDTILISVLEHHSNMLPWRKVAYERGLNIEWLDSDDYKLTPEILESHLENNASIKFVAVTGCSNVTGSITEVNKFVEICRRHNVKILVDGAQWVPHIIWGNEKYQQPDFLAFSAHKMLGPTGVGILFVRDISILTNPFLVGGNTIVKVSKDKIIFKSGYELYEAGTQDIGSVIAFGESIDYIEMKRSSSKEIENHLNTLNSKLYEKLSNIPELTLYSPREQQDRIPLFSFSIKGVHPHDISDFLDKSGIAVRSGQHCAGVLHETLLVNATTRVSAYIYNDENDINIFIEELKKCIKYYS